ncbi:MAG: pdeB [Firmicutes bacterium]|nr:pdeB [Bacillota bacterium]
MYNRRIDIVIISTSLQLENILAKAYESDESFLSFTTVEQISKLDQYNMDILIDDTFAGSMASVKSGDISTAVVLCITKQQVALLTKSVENQLADIWLKPFDPKLIQFQFRKLIGEVMLKRKYRLSQIYMDALINNMPDLIWFKRLDGIHVKVNNEFCHTVGKAKQDIEGHDHYHIWNIDKEEYENSEYVCLDTDSIVIASKTPGVFDEKVEGRRGLRQLKTYKTPIFDDNGELIGTVGAAQDVTELKNMDAELEVILKTMPFAILVQDLNGRVLNINPKFEEYFRIKKEDIIGITYNILGVKTTNDANVPDRIFNEQDKELCLQYDNTDMILKIHREPIYDFFENLIGNLYIYREITVERNFEEQLKKMAYTDELTGLFTRRYLYEYIDNNTTISQLHLLYMDLDNFKFINDTYGHHYGDILLKNIGTVLREIFPHDVCVRMGGDEFLIAIIGEVSVAEIEEQAQKLLADITTCFHIMPGAEPLSFSIGIATFAGDHPVHLDELLEKSDIALYKAKKNGKNQYAIYQPSMKKQ